MTSRPDDPADADAAAAEAAGLVAEMRAAVDRASEQLDRMTGELTAERAAVDRLETIVDLLLDVAETPVLVVDDDRRITAVSRAAARRLEAAAVGKPLSSVLPEGLAERLGTRIDAQGEGAGGASTVEGVRVHLVPGGAMLVLGRVQDGRRG